MKNISVLGSTGSIGTQTLDVVRKSEGELKVSALAAGRDISGLEKQVREFKPGLVCVGDADLAGDLKIALKDTETKVVSGMEGLIEASTVPEADTVVTAVVGMMGIKPTISAIESGKDIALANKETLVTAGHIIMPLAKEKGIKILPVDSEHSAVFQCLTAEPEAAVDNIILTASGGPFRGYSADQLEKVTLEQALAHPNWSMGKKITIDSATMVNKGLEVIEAKWLFDVTQDHIKVVVHPQSIIHSMVEFCDGAVKAQLGTPDMRLPIQYALFYPDRRPMDTERLDFYKVGKLDFEEPDMEVFKGLRFAYDALKAGGNMPTIFNAANELAVSRFLKGDISFVQIYEMIEKAMSDVDYKDDPDVEEVLMTEKEVYRVLG